MKRIYLVSMILVGTLVIGAFGYHAYAATGWLSPANTVLKALSEFTGISGADLKAAAEQFEIGRGVVPAAILTTIADVTLDDACQMVKDKTLRDYILQNGLEDAFSNQMAAFRDYLKEHYGKVLRFKLWFGKRLTTERRELIAALSKFTGIPKDTLVSLAVDEHLGGRIVPLAIAHKVTGETLQSLKELMENGQLMDHLQQEGKLQQVREEMAKFWQGAIRHITTRHKPFSAAIFAGALAKELGGKPADYLAIFKEYRDINPMKVMLSIVVSNLTGTPLEQVLSMDKGEIHTLLKNSGKLQDFRNVVRAIMSDIHRLLTRR